MQKKSKFFNSTLGFSLNISSKTDAYETKEI